MKPIASKKIGRLIVIILLSAAVFTVHACSSDFFVLPQKVSIGWIERVAFPDFDLLLEAKLDSGADTSSLHAKQIRLITLGNGEEAVEFFVEDHDGEYQRVQLPLSRQAKIKTKDGRLQIRPVVRLSVCVGGEFEETEFTLVDRSHFEYPVLIGRSFIAGKFLIDSAKSYTLAPLCYFSGNEK